MKAVNNSLKNALKQPTTQRKGKILVNGNYYEVFNVEYYSDAYNEGNVIGNAIASQLDFELPYIEKFNTFKYFDGVWTGNEYEYIDMGTFVVFDEKDEDDFNKHITAFDNLIKFNAPFVDKGDYPKTLFQELQNVCEQAGVILKNTNIPNGNFQIENNQFVSGENLKTVLKGICQISGMYAIIKEDKLVLQLKNNTNEIINKNQHEPVIWKRQTYGINQVVLGMKDIEGEYVIREDTQDIEQNGVHKLVINDNPFAYTETKRNELIDELFNQVKGFGYVPFEMNGEWLSYLDVGDTITLDGIETLLLRINGKSPKALESVMSAPAIIDSSVDYINNTNSIENQMKRTEIIVDKQNQEIELLASKTEETTKTLKTDKSVESSGEEIYIEDSGGYDLEKLRIDGKSEQKTRSGKNLLKGNISALTQVSNGVTVSYNSVNSNEVSLSGTSTSTWANISGYMPDSLPPGTYTLSIDKPIPYGLNIKGSYEDGTIFENGIAIGSTSKTFTITKSVLRRYIFVHSFATGTNVSVKFKFQLEKGSTATEIEEYGVSPSPDYPSEIESVGYTNLFNTEMEQNARNNNDGTTTIWSNKYIRTKEKIPVKPDRDYYLSYETNKKVSGGDIQFYDINGNYIKNITSDLKSKFTTLTNCYYINIQFYIVDGVTPNDISNIQLEEGLVAHSYVPYGKYGIDVNVTGKNLFINLIKNIETYNSCKYVVNSENKITITSSGTWSRVHYKISDLKPNTQYTLSSNITNSAQVNAGLYESDSNKNIGIETNALKKLTITSNENGEVLFQLWSNWSGTNSSNTVVFDNLQLEEGTATEFEPYKSNTTQLILNEPLRSLPNGIKDTYENGKIIRRIGRVVLDGSEVWYIWNDEKTDRTYFQGTNIVRNPNTQIADTDTIISTHFIQHYIDINYGNIGEIALWNTSQGYVRLCVEKSTLEDFKTWLSQNNVEVIYELAEPITEEIGFEAIPTFEKINRIDLDGGISTSFGITYLTDSELNQRFATKSEIKIATDKINILSQKIQPVSNTIKGVGQIQLENAHEGILYRLSIKGNISVINPVQGEYGYALVPSKNLTPSTTLTPSRPVPNQNITVGINNILLVDDIEHYIDFDFLNYINDTDCDEFIYEDGKCWIVRRVGIDKNGNLYATGQEVIEPRKDIVLNVKSNSTIKLKSFENAIYETQYLLENEYTDYFSTKVEVSSEIKVATDEINLEVEKKIDSGEVVSAINLSPEQIAIDSKKISLNGAFSIDKVGNPTINNGNVFVINNGASSSETDPYKISVANMHDYEYNSDGIGTSIYSDWFSMRNNNLKSRISMDTRESNATIDVYDGNARVGTQIQTVGIWSPGYNPPSSESKKKNIVLDDGCLQQILETDICSFNWNFEDDTDQKHIGGIINDLGGNYKIAPKALTHDKDAVDLYSMVGMSWKAIQELYDIIKEKDNKIKELEEQLNGIK